MDDDSEVLEIIAEFIAESIQSQDVVKQQEALQVSEYLAWKLKSLEEHRDFLRDCGGLLVDPDMSGQSLFRITWKIRFWQSFEEPIQLLLKDCDLMIIANKSWRELVVKCPNSQVANDLSNALLVLSNHIYHLTGYIRRVSLGSENRWYRITVKEAKTKNQERHTRR